MSRQCYLGDSAPGTNCSEPTSGLSDKVDNSKYTIEEGFKKTIQWYKANKKQLLRLKSVYVHKP